MPTSFIAPDICLGYPSQKTTAWIIEEKKKQPLCFTAAEANSSVKLSKLGSPSSTIYLETSRDGKAWTEYSLPSGSGTSGPEIALSSIGDKVYFREKSNPSRPDGNAVFSTGSQNNIYWFKMTGKIAASGNVQTLLKADGSRMDVPDCGFCALFNGCSSLVSAPMLPAAAVGQHSYRHMFYNCTSLSAPPYILPAKTVPASAYAYMFQRSGIQTPPIIMAESVGESGCQQMFDHCASLKRAPELKATSLGPHCYDRMFGDCSSLEKAPTVLPVETLPDGCCNEMFSGCSRLVQPPQIAATVYGGYCCYEMFAACYSLASAPEILAEEVGEYCCTSMFWQCQSLSAGPSRLPAKHLAEACYGGMFESCHLLKVGPIVEAEQMEVDSLYSMYYACSSLTSTALPIDAELADECYGDMFDGCTSLSVIPKLPSPEACSEHSNVVDTMLFNTGRPVQILDNTVDEIVELIQNEHLIGYMAWTTNPIVINCSDGTITAAYASRKWTLEITYST